MAVAAETVAAISGPAESETTDFASALSSSASASSPR